jgi:hypothetical protein
MQPPSLCSFVPNKGFGVLDAIDNSTVIIIISMLHFDKEIFVEVPFNLPLQSLEI